MIVENFVS